MCVPLKRICSEFNVLTFPRYLKKELSDIEKQPRDKWKYNIFSGFNELWHKLYQAAFLANFNAFHLHYIYMYIYDFFFSSLHLPDSDCCRIKDNKRQNGWKEILHLTCFPSPATSVCV